MKLKRLLGVAICTLLLTAAMVLSLTVFAVGENEFVLSVSTNPEESGAFQITVDGVEAMESEELAVKKGALVTVKALPAEGYTFNYWVFKTRPESVTTDQLQFSEISFTMPAENLSMEAYFGAVKDRYTVTIEEGDFGAGNFGSKDFEPSKNVFVQAYPNDGYRFVRWLDLTGALKETELPEGWEEQISFSFAMPSRDVILAPEFEAITYYVTVEVEGEGEAAIEGKEKNAQGKYEVTVGESLALTAIPGADFVFVSWSATAEAKLVDYDQKEAAVVCPASDFTLKATFASAIRSLTVKGTVGGTVRPVGTMNMGVGNVIAVTAIPNDGYVFSHWECSSTGGSFEAYEDSETNFTMPDEDCTVTAVFSKGGYRVTIKGTAGGEVKGKEGLYEMGDKVIIEASALDGYVFSHWKSSVSGAIKNPDQLKTELTVPGEDVVVTAVFKLRVTTIPDITQAPKEKENSFLWVIFVIVFLLTAITVTLVVLREQLNLSYRYLVGKGFEALKNKFKKKK